MNVYRYLIKSIDEAIVMDTEQTKTDVCCDDTVYYVHKKHYPHDGMFRIFSNRFNFLL